jgi:hypothetical protein
MNVECARHRQFVTLVVLGLAASAWLISPLWLVTVHAAGRAATRSTRRPVRLKKPHAATTPVLVELFTSEGCASCPTADTLLARLQREQPVPAAEILALEEHVDYWDSLGWRDRFALSQFSARQSAYTERLQLSSEYTPQMIVDGTEQFAGNDIVHAFHAIARAAGTHKLDLVLAPLVFDRDHVTGKVSLALRAASRHTADLYAAVVESSASTQVLGGDNTGATLNHVSIVREMRRIGTLARVRAAPLKFSLSIPQDASAANLRVVVFIQRAGQGAVLGAISSPAHLATPDDEAIGD